MHPKISLPSYLLKQKISCLAAPRTTRTQYVLTTIGRSCNGLFFPDPILFVFNITVELLQTESITQLLSSCLHRIVQCTEPITQLHLLCLNVVSIEMTGSNKLISSLCNTVNAVLKKQTRIKQFHWRTYHTLCSTMLIKITAEIL